MIRKKLTHSMWTQVNNFMITIVCTIYISKTLDSSMDLQYVRECAKISGPNTSYMQTTPYDTLRVPVHFSNPIKTTPICNPIPSLI